MDVEQRARELLAAEYEKGQFRAYAPEIRRGRGTSFDEEIRAIIAIIAALTPPEGYVLVPVEPTEAMVEASMIRVELAKRCGPGTLKVLGARAWDAMLAARPEVKND